MDTLGKNQLGVELLWWIFTLVLTALVLLPIYDRQIDFPFYMYNAVAVIAAISLTRWLFLLNISWLRGRFILQAALVFILIPLLFFLGQGLNEFITYLDNNGPDYFVRNLPEQYAKAMNTYLRSEYFFFGIWAIVAGVLLPFRIFHHVWKYYKSSKTR